MSWAKGISRVVVVPGLGKTPAMVGHQSGTIFLNAEKLPGMSEDELMSIMSHEKGHIEGQTTNEFKADELGFKDYVTKGGSLKASYQTLLKHLDFSNPEHHERLKRQIVRVLLHDWKVNKNKKALAGLQELLPLFLEEPQAEIKDIGFLSNVERT